MGIIFNAWRSWYYGTIFILSTDRKFLWVWNILFIICPSFLNVSIINPSIQIKWNINIKKPNIKSQGSTQNNNEFQNFKEFVYLGCVSYENKIEDINSRVIDGKRAYFSFVAAAFVMVIVVSNVQAFGWLAILLPNTLWLY